MSALTFDTYKAIQSLIDKGVEREQAEGITQVIQQAQETHLEELATKGDLKDITIQIHRAVLTLGSLIVAMTGLILAVMQLGGAR